MSIPELLSQLWNVYLSGQLEGHFVTTQLFSVLLIYDLLDKIIPDLSANTLGIG